VLENSSATDILSLIPLNKQCLVSTLIRLRDTTFRIGIDVPTLNTNALDVAAQIKAFVENLSPLANLELFDYDLNSCNIIQLPRGIIELPLCSPPSLKGQGYDQEYIDMIEKREYVYRGLDIVLQKHSGFTIRGAPMMRVDGTNTVVLYPTKVVGVIFISEVFLKLKGLSIAKPDNMSNSTVIVANGGILSMVECELTGSKGGETILNVCDASICYVFNSGIHSNDKCEQACFVSGTNAHLRLIDTEIHHNSGGLFAMDGGEITLYRTRVSTSRFDIDQTREYESQSLAEYVTKAKEETKILLQILILVGSMTKKNMKTNIDTEDIAIDEFY
jgi:hypothetical protein